MLNYEKILKMSNYNLYYDNNAIIKFEEYNKLRDFLFEKNFKLYLDYVIEETKKLKVHWDKIENYDIDKYIEKYEENLADKIVDYIRENNKEIQPLTFDAEKFINKNDLEYLKDESINLVCEFSRKELFEILKYNYIKDVNDEELRYKISESILYDSEYSNVTDLVLTKLGK